MDISDGLSSDVNRLCSESSVGARIWADRIPQVGFRDLKKIGLKREVRNWHALQLALHGGDDYELLFTVPQSRVKKLKKAPERSAITEVGVIERGNRVRIVDSDGRTEILKRGGWDPFADRKNQIG